MPAKVGAAVDGYRFHLLAKGLAKQTTVKNYTDGATLWVRWCDAQGMDYRRATRNDMLAWLGGLAETHRESTVRLRLICLRVFYDYLLAEKKVRVNPARAIALTRQLARPVEPLSSDELVRLIAACRDYQERALLLLLLGGGLRRAEVYQVNRSTANFAEGTITVLGKGSKYRTVKPGRAAMEALKVALAFDERLFAHMDEEVVWRIVKRLATRAGIDGRTFPHRFRYTFAAHFLDAGGSAEDLQDILGHEHITMSLHYARAGRLRRAQEAQLRYNPADRLLGYGDVEAGS